MARRHVPSVAIANSRPWAGGREGHNYEMDVGTAPDEPYSTRKILRLFCARVGDGKLSFSDAWSWRFIYFER